MGGRKPRGIRRDDAYLGGRPEGSLGDMALTYGNFELPNDERATVGKASRRPKPIAMARHNTHQSMVLFNCGQVLVGKNPCTQGEGNDQKGDNGPTREQQWNGEAATQVLQDNINADRYGHSCNDQDENSWTG